RPPAVHFAPIGAAAAWLLRGSSPSIGRTRPPPASRSAFDDAEARREDNQNPIQFTILTSPVFFCKWNIGHDLISKVAIIEAGNERFSCRIHRNEQRVKLDASTSFITSKRRKPEEFAMSIFANYQSRYE